MFVVLLRFAEGRDRAAKYLDGHKAWLQSGFDAGVFLVAGSLQPNQGGAIIAQGVSLAELQSHVAEDPFVVHDVVTVEILEITPSQLDKRLAFVQD